MKHLQTLCCHFWIRPFLRCLSVVLLFLFSLSCSFFIDDKETHFTEENIDNANFIVDQVEGHVVATRVNGLPEEIQISYTACFRDFVHPDNTLQNSLFKIHFFEDFSNAKDLTGEGASTVKACFTKKAASRSIINGEEEEGSDNKECSRSSSFLFSSASEISCLQMRTDSSGCLKWTEVYPYNYVNQSAWFRYNRAFEGEGAYKGVKIVPIAVNPWLSSVPSGSASLLQLVDLRYHDIDRGKWKLIDLKDQDIPECGSCTSNKDEVDCKLCHKKKRSLSFVMMSECEKGMDRPRLWVSKLDSNIKQEYISLQSKGADGPEYKQALKKFKVCQHSSDANCDSAGRFFKVRLKIPLRMKVKNYRKEEELLPLIRGDYSVKVYLFLKSNEGKNIVLHRDMGFASASLTTGADNYLKSEFYLHIPYENYGLSAFLGLRVQAENELKDSLIPFEGVFSFPDKLKSVVGNNNLDLEKKAISFYENPSSNDNSLIGTYKLSGSWLEKKSTGFRKAGWDVKLKRLRFSDIRIANNKCPTPVDRTVRYVGEICIIDPLTDDVVPNTGITIKRQDVSFSGEGTAREGQTIDIPIIKRKEPEDDDIFTIDGVHRNLGGHPLENDPNPYISDTSGCLQWVDELQHNWYNREKYFLRKMVFSKKEWGFEGERMIAINPWHWGFVFFQDVTQLGGKAIRTSAERAERPRVVLHDFRSVFPDLIYTIDRWLGINVFQNLLFLFRVRVDRPDNVSVGQGAQSPSAKDVRRGYYFLRFILVKSHTEESGGSGNQVVNDHTYRRGYREVNSWNTHTGWKLDRNGDNTGQMMSTNLEYITHFDTYVQIRDSVVNVYANFLFDLDEFIFIGSNNRVIVQLLPTDPSLYTYKEGSCAVDPSKSDFKPFTNHELITQPFMGTFVPSDLRNWNIFKVVSENTKLSPPRNNDILSLDMDAWQLEQFIKQGKEHKTHQLFTKLNTNINVSVQTGEVSPRSRDLVKDIAPVLQVFYEYMERFLVERSTDDNQLFSAFDDRKNKLIEAVDETTTAISGISGGMANDDNVKKFFLGVQNLLNDILDVLNSPQDNLDMQRKIKKKRENFLNLVSKHFPYILSTEFIEQWIKEKRKEEEKNRWFSPDIDFPDSPEDWSEFNMNLFATDEGLKVITMDNKTLVDEFVSDLNASAKIHNGYHSEYRNRIQHDNRVLIDDAWAQRVIDKRDGGYRNFPSHGDVAADYQNDQQAFWTNFELINDDNYHAINRKIRQMYVPRFSKDWLNTVLTKGIHSGTMNRPEVMVFLHSLCGFWFDKFYEKYLEQKQLDVIFAKHMDHFRYYSSTLSYTGSQSSAWDQYQAFYEAMQQYNLVEMDQSVLTRKNPFLVYDIKEDASLLGILWDDLLQYLHLHFPVNFFGTWWDDFFNSEEEEKEEEEKEEEEKEEEEKEEEEKEEEEKEEEEKKEEINTVIEALYKDKQLRWEAALQAQALVATPGLPSNMAGSMLENYRHPYFKCLANPFNFFHIEKKIIVGDIGSDYSDLKYEYGVTKSFNVQRAFDYAYSATWSMSRSFSTSLGTGFTAMGLGGGAGAGALARFLNPLNVVNPFLSFSGVRLNSDWSTSRSKSDGNRRQQSLRFADESLYLQANHSAISVRLKRFRHCLIVRPQNLAFDKYKKEKVWIKELAENFIYQIPYIKSGLMICSEDIDADRSVVPFSVTEDYFYLYQLKPGDSGQFQNPLSFRNRPFVMSIRGKTEMEKFTFLIHAFVEADKGEVEDYDPFGLMTNPYEKESKPAEGTRQAVKKAKVWDKTGFYPGVYSVKYDNEHFYFRPSPSRKRSEIERFGGWLFNNNPLGSIRMDDKEPVVDRRDNND